MELDLATVTIGTSYFPMVKYVKNPVSIAGLMPPWAKKYGVKHFPHLAPTRQLVMDYKGGIITPEQFIAEYKRSKLDRWKAPIELVEELVTHFGPIMTLICWENPDMFCHRKLVAKFIESGTPLKVKEWDKFQEDEGAIVINPRGS